MMDANHWGIPPENGTEIDGEGLRQVIQTLRSSGVSHTGDGILIRATVPPGSIMELLAIAEAAIPRTKLIDAWHVEYWDNSERCLIVLPVEGTKEAAQAFAIEHCRRAHFLCVRITGPYKHLVPADDGRPPLPPLDADNTRGVG